MSWSSCLLFSVQYCSRVLLRMKKGQVQINVMDAIHVMKFKFVCAKWGHYQVTLTDLLRLHLGNDANEKNAQFYLDSTKKLSSNFKMKQSAKRICVKTTDAIHSFGMGWLLIQYYLHQHTRHILINYIIIWHRFISNIMKAIRLLFMFVCIQFCLICATQCTRTFVVCRSIVFFDAVFQPSFLVKSFIYSFSTRLAHTPW